MTQTPEYLALKDFLRSFTERFVDSRSKASAERPLAVFEAIERADPPRAAASLRMAINNCLELSAHWPYAQVTALDAELHAEGSLSLSQVRRRVWGRYAAMIKHAQVRGEAEYQVVRAALADVALSSELPAAERLKLQSVLANYEKERPNPSLERTRKGRPASAASSASAPAGLPLRSAQLKR